MPITAAELLFKYSVKTGTAGNTTAGTAAGSLGKYISGPSPATQIITSPLLHNLFDVVSSAEASAGDVEYRCFFIHNSNATLTLNNTEVWIDSQVSSGATIEIAVDSIAASAIGSSSAQALEVANESTAPSGLTFSSPSSSAPLAMGNITNGYCRAIWVKRNVPASSARLSNDGAVIKFRGETE